MLQAPSGAHGVGGRIIACGAKRSRLRRGQPSLRLPLSDLWAAARAPAPMRTARAIPIARHCARRTGPARSRAGPTRPRDGGDLRGARDRIRPRAIAHRTWVLLPRHFPSHEQAGVSTGPSKPAEASAPNAKQARFRSAGAGHSRPLPDNLSRARQGARRRRVDRPPVGYRSTPEGGTTPSRLLLVRSGHLADLGGDVCFDAKRRSVLGPRGVCARS